MAESIGQPNLFKLIDHFALYCGTQTLAKSLAVYEIVKDSIDVPGDIIEFGCWNGSNLMLMSKCLKLLQPYSMKEVYGFDSFEGLQTFAEEDNVDQSNLNGAYKGNEEVLRSFLKLYELDTHVKLIKGNALNTIDKFSKDNPHFIDEFRIY